ncbi:DNA oxidative demethylase ALKBH2-like [Chenopodium quinoa]|uniref:DNA oxidative demethylase ALKBH2-like n=1 Tax=Chenopodium quinoa TaxID=63459 RepID=UPI000B76E8C3|nr:DNA oxidative demethylase ALKBH2-like [Chenopodium quinoa]
MESSKAKECENEKSDSNAVNLNKSNSKRVEGEGELLLSEIRKSNIKSKIIELGNGSEVEYYPRFLEYEDAWKYFEYLNNHIPWTRPTIHVFGRSCLQPRESCYVASEGVSKLKYSGYQPHAYPWHQFPPLNHLLQAVEDAVPGSHFNSLLLNRYNCGNDYVSWHSDDEPLYGPTPLIASLSFGCERHFFLKKKSNKSVSKANSSNEPASKRLKTTNNADQDQHSFLLKHGSLLVMKGYTQRDWIHSVPKRTKLDAVRINLTFRLVL